MPALEVKGLHIPCLIGPAAMLDGVGSPCSCWKGTVMRNAIVAAPMFAIAMLLTACTGVADEGGTEVTANSDKTAGQVEQKDSGGTGAVGTFQLGAVNLHEQSFELYWREAVNLAQAAFDGDLCEIELEVDNMGKYHDKIDMLSVTEK